MASNTYECLFILDSNRYARDPNALTTMIPTMVKNLGGEVLASRLWTEQKLAYSIKGHRKGTYWLTYFTLASEKLSEFHRACQLNDNILRNLVLRVDPRLVDVLVSHATGKAVPAVQESKDTAGKTERTPNGAAPAAVEAPAES